ncbi:nucleoside diphosphate kinase 6 [Condylostylus longicornis]|uniref:nucleoside diphosphate kinase 6 n=1 Tax=Condylostylus longicornis TaxID=2530218 RepID=UPI00244E377A|nr:nucleoside diphosphate kinase 6 [Condylostylus longicornis]
MKELTFALIKPHIVKNSIVVERIMNVINEKFKILEIKKVHMDDQMACQFYEEHVGKFYFDRLMKLMCSGPTLALILEGNNSIKIWREIMGPTKVYKSVHTHPNTLRSLYGISDTRNVCHGSDSAESVKREISIMFPKFGYDKYINS